MLKETSAIAGAAPPYILYKLNDGETLDDHYMNKQLEEFLAD